MPPVPRRAGRAAARPVSGIDVARVSFGFEILEARMPLAGRSDTPRTVLRRIAPGQNQELGFRFGVHVNFHTILWRTLRLP